MASSDDFSPSSDELGSSSADERPNRWRGPKSTWRQFNADEIDTAAALDQLRNRDLAAHLYNAFALTQRHDAAATPPTLSQHAGHEPVPGHDINTATGKPVKPDTWAPPRAWTAWPMKSDLVPEPDFMGTRRDGPDEELTLRRIAADETPRDQLVECISAAALRHAKERLDARRWADEGAAGMGADTTDADDAATQSDQPGRSGSRLRGTQGAASSASEMDVDMSSDTGACSRRKRAARRVPLRPAFAADDDASYALLRPSMLVVLDRLDAALSVLHHAQEATVNHLSDSSDSENSESSRRTVTRASSTDYASEATDKGAGSKGKGLGRPRKYQTAPTAQAANPPLAKKRGRPRKVIARLSGETDYEYEVRRAKIMKRPIPAPDGGVSSREISAAQAVGVAPQSQAIVEEGEGNAEAARGSGAKQATEIDSGDEPGGESAEEEESDTAPKRRARFTRPTAVARDHETAAAASVTSREQQQADHTRKPRAGPRGWRDVVGAAALAGFPAAALDRAARRCADLFGGSMELHTLREHAEPGTAASSWARARTTRYYPGMAGMPPEPSVETPDRVPEPYRPRAGGGGGVSDAPPSESEGDSRRPARSQTPAGSRPSSRSRSGSPGAGIVVYCERADCPRSTSGFARRSNLTRHMKLVHGVAVDDGGGGGGGVAPASELLLAHLVDSEDEMLGLVHADGFLKPVRARPGWASWGRPQQQQHQQQRRGPDTASSGGESGGVGAVKPRKRKRERVSSSRGATAVTLRKGDSVEDGGST